MLIIGFERTITAMVAGTKKREVYLTDEVNMFFKSCGSFSGLIFAKVGKRTWDIGIVTKVMSTLKLVVIL